MVWQVCGKIFLEFWSSHTEAEKFFSYCKLDLDSLRI